MSEPFLSEIRIFSFNHPPAGWALCDGQVLPIAQNQALFALLGTVYGGDGETTFALPDLRGQVPIHRGNGHALGQTTGASSVTLAVAQLPQHTHTLAASRANAATSNPTNGFLAASNDLYAAPAAGGTTTIHPGSVTPAGGSQPHGNMMPYLVLSFCMALEGSSPATGGDPSTAQPYVGEVRIFTGNFAPSGWMFCNGQLLAISGNETLFQLIGTTYGGDGEESFALPNLRSRVPLHRGTGPDGIAYPIAQMAGTEGVTLTVQQIPIHTHPLTASVAVGSTGNPGGSLLAEGPGGIQPYIEDSPAVAMNAGSVVPAGGSQPHENSQPFLCIHYIISLSGIFPSPA
jgi:microcystin-dependent protein